MSLCFKFNGILIIVVNKILCLNDFRVVLENGLLLHFITKRGLENNPLF